MKRKITERSVECFHVETWFERDRQNIRLVAEWPDGHEEDVLCFWDDEIRQMVEEGFLDPCDWLNSCLEYASSVGLIPSKDSCR